MTAAIYDPVVVHCAALGWPTRRPYAREAEEIVRRLHEAGFSDGQMAVRVQRSRRTVMRIRERLGLATHLAGTNGLTRPQQDAPSRKPEEH